MKHTPPERERERAGKGGSRTNKQREIDHNGNNTCEANAYEGGSPYGEPP